MYIFRNIALILRETVMENQDLNRKGNRKKNKQIVITATLKAAGAVHENVETAAVRTAIISSWEAKSQGKLNNHFASYLRTPAAIRLEDSLRCGSMLSISERGAPAHLRSAHTAPVGCKPRAKTAAATPTLWLIVLFTIPLIGL